jgi:hypothetical protein
MYQFAAADTGDQGARGTRDTHGTCPQCDGHCGVTCVEAPRCGRVAPTWVECLELARTFTALVLKGACCPHVCMYGRETSDIHAVFSFTVAKLDFDFALRISDKARNR